MLTTVVGSYPSFPRQPSSIGEKISNCMGSYDAYKSALELAVQDQVKAGVNLISDGQVRGNMLEVFAREIPGMITKDGIPIIIDRIQPAPHSIGASDIKMALKTASKLSSDFSNDLQILSKNKFQDKFKGIKAIITGPTTLALSSRIEGFYSKDEKNEAIIDIASVLKKEAEHLQNAGAAVIQIDEPFLSTGIADLKIAKKAIEIIVNDLHQPTSIHVCGPISEVIDDLLKFKVSIIDCEFADQNKNLEALESINLNGKKMGLGCIDTKTNTVETKEQVASIIKKGIELVGKENLIADPDCGMRLRSREAAYSKLKIMVETVKWLS
ncbi:MAG: methionine synthase [Methanobacterium sp.]|jgi:5-methyltetrahydropteroyltriglutamate--homocysteine methyltransferase